MMVPVPLNWLGCSDSFSGGDDGVYPIDLLVVDDGILVLLFFLVADADAADAAFAAVCSARVGVGAFCLST